ncbi:unnamed protein product [Rotaria sp. Silwood1]|nr:unnamed protein product [Rotaria sp. Silwood1]CAF3739686.1 unnamed protein product [Rotaria sp. Silwood1]CAF4741406.1 unnamed protein product [Rotaria sp. Silwood1]CAF4766756.1 unnamed protein product [Rotaria sp. Silwood1]CAF4858121.1 unnamed protein product [Rotaria sp. Silwood1]
MTSVERVLDYCSLDQESPAQVPPNLRPPLSWPSHGEIVFNNVSMRHSTQTYLPLDLDHISMTIRASEKVGIVGRTGAGKSSLIQTLFRIGTLVDGQIKIDNIDIASVGLDDVRRRISIVPQDSVIFTGTMRSNLDPFTDYSDEEIWHALEEVQLKTLVAEAMSDGLHSMVLGHGKLLEFDTPAVLLSNPTSHFTSLVEHSGSVEAKHLRALANAKLSQQSINHGCINDGMDITSN